MIWSTELAGNDKDSVNLVTLASGREGYCLIQGMTKLARALRSSPFQRRWQYANSEIGEGARS
jgi:hypothetical protein